jgi:uncharacterized membrane protein YoaK (UPF0700 family)
MTDEAPRKPSSSKRLLAGLFILTAATGIVDAVSVLRLGHVFTANMTGNVVFSGFALGGAKGFSLGASVAALAAFVVGALIAGRIWPPGRSSGPIGIAFGLETAALAGATVGAGFVSSPDQGGGQLLLVALLGIGMGLQNGTVRRLAVPDMTTTVLTLTITGIASDSTIAGGTNPNIVRRVTNIALMLSGAILGARLVDHSLTWALATASTTIAIGAAMVTRSR